MKRILGFIFILLFAGVTSAGTKEDLAQIQRNLIELQQQFWDLEKQLKDGSANVAETVKTVQDSAENMRQTQAALNAKLEKVLDQLQALDQKLEETNQRIREASGPVAPRPINPSNTLEGQPDNGTPPAGAQALTPVESTVDEQQTYRDAMGQYTKGNFEQALRSFQDLIDQHPGSRMADDAQFMIGESFYGMKEYVDAVSEYDKVIKGFPDSDRVPGAKLKKAFSLFSLGKKGQGAMELQQIVQRYPTTKEAQIAKQRLAELGLE